jgi:hypothetical protein
MSIFWAGMKNGKCVLLETEKGDRLVFSGAEVDKFAQVKTPFRGQPVAFPLPLADLVGHGLLPPNMALALA